MKKCWQCAEEVQDEAIVCRFCRANLGGPQNPAATGGRPGKLGPAIVLGGAILFIVAMCSEAESPKAVNDTAAYERAAKWQQGAAKTSPGDLAQPAPKGMPKDVALAAIRDAEHPCPSVKEALRLPDDGSIMAECSNGERYRVFDVKDVGTVAMKCSAAKQHGIEGVC